MTRPSLYLAVTGVGSISAIKASAAESTELDTPASGCWFSVHASTNAADIFTPEIQQFLRPLNLLQMNGPVAAPGNEAEVFSRQNPPPHAYHLEHTLSKQARRVVWLIFHLNRPPPRSRN